MRIILFTGKGGVGKTSVAAASALRSAEMGHKTIVMSTDAAHSLGDSLDVPLSGVPKEVAPNLWAQELDILREINVHWGTLHGWISSVMAWRGLDKIMADEMAVLPGMDELAGLLYIQQYHDEGQYDVVMVDCAPTGETLRLLSFPEVLKWWMEHIYPIERRAVGILRPMVRPFSDIPLPTDEIFDAVKELFQRLDIMHSILTDPEKTSVRLVLNPEKMVIKEAQRTYTYLSLYGYHVDQVVSNRFIPSTVTDPYFAAWLEAQARHEQAVGEAFAPLPIARVPLLDQEVVGFEMLRKMAQALYGDGDPTQLFFRGLSREVEKVDGHYTMTILLPFVEKQDISLTQTGDELVVQVGNQKRNIILPHALAGLTALEAKFEGDRLRIRFI